MSTWRYQHVAGIGGQVIADGVVYNVLAEHGPQIAASPIMLAALEDIYAEAEARQDVRDGPDGQPRPDAWMSVAITASEAITAAGKEPPCPRPRPLKAIETLAARLIGSYFSACNGGHAPGRECNYCLTSELLRIARDAQH